MPQPSIHRFGRSLGVLFLTLLQPLVLGAQERELESNAGGLSQSKDKSGPLLSRRSNELEWQARLAAPDLMQRQASYDLLLLRANIDPAVDPFFKRLAQDASQPGLAWTARLALREMDLRRKLEQKTSSNILDAMVGPYGSEQRLESIMHQLVIEYPAWQFGIQEVRPSKPEQNPADEVSGGQPERVRVRTDVLGVYVKSALSDTPPRPGQRPGLEVVLLAPDSVAKRMSLALGDVLLRVNGRPIFLPEDITKAMAFEGQQPPITVQWIDRSQVIQSATWTPDNK